jgi:hypothetical protein
MVQASMPETPAVRVGFELFGSAKGKPSAEAHQTMAGATALNSLNVSVDSRVT